MIIGSGSVRATMRRESRGPTVHGKQKAVSNHQPSFLFTETQVHTHFRHSSAFTVVACLVLFFLGPWWLTASSKVYMESKQGGCLSTLPLISMNHHPCHL